jgi:hypothetical protein
MGMGALSAALKKWLREKRERRLILLEDDLAAIDACLSGEFARELFLNPQIIVHYFTDLSQLDELIAYYACDRIEVAALESYRSKKKRKFQQLRLKLLRQSATAHAILTEALYSHKLLSNLLPNIRRWHGSFLASGLKGKFQGIPAVICGAGPSLEANLSTLKELEDRALIIAGGSTIAALSNRGITPHLGIALDPNPEEYGRLKAASAFEIPLIYATRLQPDVFNTQNGERGYLVSDTGGPCERYFEKEVGIDADPIGPELGPEAFSVTTLAIALAVEMGCNPIFLNGIDLAYTGMRRYAEGVVPSSKVSLNEILQVKKAPDRLLRRKDINGHYVHTLVKWVMESDCIAAYAKAHPQVSFINVSPGGIGFSGISNQSLLEAIEECATSPLDLRGLVHAEIQQLKIASSKEKIAQSMQEVKESLIRLSVIAQEMLEELERVKKLPFLEGICLPTGRMAILEIDFQEERAFECLLPALGPALDKLLARAFFTAPQSGPAEKQRVLLESKLAKWTQFKAMIDSEIEFFNASLRSAIG